MRTEDVSPRFAGLDTWPAPDLVAALVEGQMAAAAAVRTASAALSAAVEAAAERLSGDKGRLVYAGAGTSGRLAVQDGAELLPTYGWPVERLVYLMAGGEAALIHAVEGAEDDRDAAAEAVRIHGVGAGDVVVCVAASGGTPFTVKVAEAARADGALTIGLANNADARLLAAVEHPIVLPTGPEVVAGSTRLAAGTAQKAALNTFSTALMVRLKHTYSNLMVDLASSNIKLEGRRIAMLRRIVDVGDDAAAEALRAAGGHVKLAVLIARGLDRDTAHGLLDLHGGDLRAALATLPA